MSVNGVEIIKNLDNMENAMKKISRKKEPKLNIFYVYILVIVISDLILYPLFPILLNYPPGSINTRFDAEFSKIPYYQQYLIINLLIVMFGYFLFKKAFKGIDKWRYIAKSIESHDISQIKEIRRRSFNIPNMVYLLQIIIPLIFVEILFIVLEFRNSSDIKFFLILIIGLMLTGQISHLLAKKYFRKVLQFTYINDSEIINDSETKIIRVGLRYKTLFHIFPLFLFSTLFIVLMGQAGLIKEKGNALFKNYHRELQEKFGNISYIENEDQINDILKLIKLENKKDITFYIDPDKKYKTSDNSRLSKFFLKYTQELAFKYNGHTYDYYGSDVQGAVIKLPGTNGNWIVGIKYIVESPENMAFLIISFIVLSVFAVFILLFYGKNLADDITLIANGLQEIAEGSEADLSRKIAVTSNDEIGDLVMAFNKVQEREKDYIQKIKEQQRIILEQERLASLGQMIGGIIHNFNTPISSLNNSINALQELVGEYQASIGDVRVTDYDHLEIAAEMRTWLIEIKSHCNYLDEVLTTVKGQILQRETSLQSSFALKDLLKRVDILTKYQLKKSGCVIHYDIKVDQSIKIPGEIIDLVQVLENLISNSIQAYKDKGGVIELAIRLKGDLLELRVKDKGSGISDKVKDKLFKEIITTKGKKGNGLGLYVSSAIIKGKFGGNIWFDSTLGQGTTFYVSIPLNRITNSISTMK